MPQGSARCNFGCVLNPRETAPSQDLDRVGSYFGGAKGHSVQYTWRRRRGKRARMAMIPESSVLGDSTHDRISPDGLMLKKQSWNNATAAESTESFSDIFVNIFASRTRSWSLCSWQSTESGSHWLRGTDVAWRQYLPVVLKDSQSSC